MWSLFIWWQLLKTNRMTEEQGYLPCMYNRCCIARILVWKKNCTVLEKNRKSKDDDDWMTRNMYTAVSRKVVSYATMSKVIMGNRDFTVPWLERCLSVLKETTQTRVFIISPSFLLDTLTTHNTNRHWRVGFYTFVGQPLLKQLYIAVISNSYGSIVSRED